MKKTTLLAACGIATMVTGATIADQPALVANPSGQGIKLVSNDRQMPAGVLYDNGEWDGINGYSAILGGGFDLDRSLLDDFMVPAGGWDIGSCATQYIWNNGLIGQGADMEVTFYTDGGGCDPTTLITGTTNTSYTETDLGFQAFSREAVLLEVTFNTVHLDEGHYWVEMKPVAGSDDNGFILTTAVKDCPCWVDYADFGGLQPGINIFGVDSDVTFTLGDGGGPSDCLTLEVTGLVGGGTAVFTVSGGTPGEAAAVAWGLPNTPNSTGSDVNGWCVTFGFNINLKGRRVRIVGASPFDDTGVATIQSNVPAARSGMEMLFQAAEHNTCPAECMSNILDEVIG